MQRSILRDILHTFSAQCFRSHVAIQTAFIFGLKLRACSTFYPDPLKIALSFIWFYEILEGLSLTFGSSKSVQGRTSCAIASPSQQQRCSWQSHVLFCFLNPVADIVTVPKTSVDPRKTKMTGQTVWKVQNDLNYYWLSSTNSTTYCYGVRFRTDWPRSELRSDGGCIHLLARSQSWFAETRLLLNLCSVVSVALIDLISPSSLIYAAGKAWGSQASGRSDNEQLSKVLWQGI